MTLTAGARVGVDGGRELAFRVEQYEAVKRRQKDSNEKRAPNRAQGFLVPGP